jgi:hypothetical protein
MKPETLTEQEIEDLTVLIRGQFGPQFSEPLISKIVKMNMFVGSLEEGHEVGSDAVEFVGINDVAWEDDDA